MRIQGIFNSFKASLVFDNARRNTMDSLEGLDVRWLSRLMERHYYKDEPADVINVEVEDAVPKGENYNSVIKRVKFNILTASGARKTFSMITKQSKDSDEAKATSTRPLPFRREIRMFTTVLQYMEGLMEEFSDQRDTLWPKFYGCEPYNLMVLEDLKESGYIAMDRTAWLALDHALLALRSIGRFHAMSQVLMGRGLIGRAEDKGKYWASLENPVKFGLLKSGLYMLAQAMLKKSGSWTSGWESLAERILKRRDSICGDLERLFIDYDRKFDVLCHGDPWTSNMMFEKMEYTSIPCSLKLLDYQFPHVNSFMWDVTYFLYTSVVPSVRRSNKDSLLKAYHRSLANNLDFFNYKGYVPTLNDVFKEDERLLLAGFAFVTCVLPFTSATTKDVFVMENLFTGTPEEIFQPAAFSEEKLVEGIGDDIKEFANLGLI